MNYSETTKMKRVFGQKKTKLKIFLPDRQMPEIA